MASFARSASLRRACDLSWFACVAVSCFLGSLLLFFGILARNCYVWYLLCAALNIWKKIKKKRKKALLLLLLLQLGSITYGTILLLLMV